MSCKIKTAMFVLAASAASMSFAQDLIPVVESSGVSRPVEAPKLQAGVPVNVAGSQAAETLYQQQLLQQEVQELRGIVEQLTHDIKRMREEQRDRYLDLDRRITLLSHTPAKVEPVTAKPAQAVAEKPTALASKPEPVISPATVVAAQEKDTKAAEKEAYQTAFGLVRSKQYARASEAFVKLIKDYPDGYYTGNAYYWLGEVQLVESQSEQALTTFETLLEKYPAHRKAADAKFKLGKIHLKMGDKARAKVLLQDVVNEYSGSSAAKLAEAAIRDAQL